MLAQEQTSPKLPLPKWCFAILAVPTFYMPLVWLILMIWVIGHMLIGQLADVPQWMKAVLESALDVTFVMWPIYIAWVVISKRLTLREKCWWLFVVVMLNMVGMPWFYVFMLRRYLGIEGRTGPRDEAALDRFLKKCGRCRDQLSDEQLGVLRSYCRTHRLMRWVAVFWVVVAALGIDLGVVFIPKHMIPMLTEMTPTRTIVIDSAKNTRNEISPDPETERLHVQLTMYLGGVAGVAASVGFFFLVMAVSQCSGNGHRKALMDFLKAGNEVK